MGKALSAKILDLLGCQLVSDSIDNIFTREGAPFYFAKILSSFFFVLHFDGNPPVFRFLYPHPKGFFLISAVISLLLSLMEDKMLYINQCCLQFRLENYLPSDIVFCVVRLRSRKEVMNRKLQNANYSEYN